MSIAKIKIYLIGIGGIGVSALARYYLEKGCKVSGSDLVTSEITESLMKRGAKIYCGPHKVKNIPENADLVIYSPAVKSDNPELLEAKVLKFPIKSYPEALGDLVKKYFTIAVSGTHGKSTTTAMLGILLTRAGLDPTVIVGTKVKEFSNSNCRVGKSEYLVIEADEHFASFLNYWPKIVVLTTIEADHLDYYKNLGNVLKTFKKYIGHLPKNGVIVANKDDKNISKILGGNKHLTSFYTLKQKEAKKLRKVLKVPGDHNVSNALAALTAARILKIPDKISFDSLAKYHGSWRRFEEKVLKIGNYHLRIIHDYGHHPTEIRVTLKAAREKYPKKRIWCVFQPHQYQRTYYLFNDFVRTFRRTVIDKIIITDIYDVAGREEGKIKEKVSSEKLVKDIKKKNIIYLSKKEIRNYVEQNIFEIDILIVMGAGDIYELFTESTS